RRDLRKPASMRGKLVVTAALAVAAGVIGLWVLTIPEMVPASALAAHVPDLANGKVMFDAGGCVDCHTRPKQDDRRRLGGGAPINSQFGVFYPPNISPDLNDGIGAWTEADFITALTKGTSPDGRHFYPAFPYASYQHMRTDDLRDLFAYLKTLPPVAGRTRAHALSFPFNIRRGVGVWKLMFLDGQPFHPDPRQSQQWNRGAYLVNGPGHCAECDSPRNWLGAVIADKRFAGGKSPDGQGGVPNITQAKLAKWTEADFFNTLTTGATPDSDPVGGAMAEVVRSTSQLPETDRAAMATYLKSLPPVSSP